MFLLIVLSLIKWYNYSGRLGVNSNIAVFKIPK
jgi:hypothetical protein